MALIQINYLSKALFRTVPVNVILPVDKIDYGRIEYLYTGQKLIEKGADVTWDEEEAGHEWDFWDSQIKKVLDWLPLDDINSGLSSGNVNLERG